MGNYRIVINAVGGHGCQRDKKDGATVAFCDSFYCPDCHTRRLIKTLQLTSNTVNDATLTHWPGTPQEVSDDLLSGKRSGSF
jgi:hypothetical protein